MMTRNILKYTITLLLLPFLMVFTYSCKDDDKEKVNFKIVKTTIEEKPIYVKGSIELSSADFEFKVVHDWCQVTKDGNILNVAAGENPDILNRSTEIVVTSGSVEYSIPVTQSGILFELTSDKFKELTYSLIGGDREIRLLSNIEHEIIIPEEDKDWIKVEEGEKGYYDIIIAESTTRRNSTVTFKYASKLIPITIRQYNYLSYFELIGDAKMSYTNSKGERVETEIEFLEKVKNEEFYIKGTFESKKERLLPIKYLELEKGELRFHPIMIDDAFEDPDFDEKIGALYLFMFANRTNTATNKTSETYSKTPGNYYPGKFEIDDANNEAFYEFKHSDSGYPGAGSWKYYTRGMAIRGTGKGGNVLNINPYDILENIVIRKKLN